MSGDAVESQPDWPTELAACPILHKPFSLETLFTMVNQGAQQPALYTLAIAGALISIIPLIALFLGLQRYWRIDLISGGLKG